MPKERTVAEKPEMHWRNSWCSSFLLVLPTVLMRRTGEGPEDRREAAAVSAVLCHNLQASSLRTRTEGAPGP